MQQRITFVHKPADAIDPQSIKITNDSFSFSGLQAVREDRITLGLTELPDKVQHVLNQSHELHIRYEYPEPEHEYDSKVIPLLSRVPPGLHVYYTPRQGSNDAGDSLCQFLERLLDIDEADQSLQCQSLEKSFTRLPSQRFQNSAAYSYYVPQVIFRKSAIAKYILSHCASDCLSCRERIWSLRKADSMDISYSAIAHTLTISTTTPSQLWNTTLQSSGPGNRLEVGLISTEPAFEPEHLSMGGFLTVVGEDSKPSPVHFTFPARHHPLSSKYSVHFQAPTGLHPTMQVSVSDISPPKDGEGCALHAYLTLPKSIFADKYQLSDPRFLQSKNLSALRYYSDDVDLEAPAYTTETWGSSLLLELDTSDKLHNFTAEIPLHLRYMPLAPHKLSYAYTEIPDPVVFWACRGIEGSKYTVNPFDRVNLGYDGLFGPRTIFYHLNPVRSSEAHGPEGIALNERYMSIAVPVIGSYYGETIKNGTGIVVLAGFLWVLYKVLQVLATDGYGSGKKMVVVEEKKNK